ncbi:plasma membrane Pth11 protein [Rutstroemia sp. NJR-2017a WRK4]|nr:plasma membrane Pth11 protein [Rutstroemia sp. NJR-2017a WRK4]
MASLQIHAPLVLAAAGTFIPLCSLSVALRIYARKVRKVGLGVDDYLIMGALVFVIGMAVTIIAEVATHQLGYPAPAPSTQVGKPNANITFYPPSLLLPPTLGLIKLSLIFFYRRSFSVHAASRFNVVTWIAALLILLWTLSFFFSLVFICGVNFSAYWASTVIEKEYCTDTSLLHNAFAVSDVLTDVGVLSLPVPMIFGLRLTFERKVGILAVFGLGALTIAASIVRMVIFIQATAGIYNPLQLHVLCTTGLYFSLLECALGLLAACLPAQYGLLSTQGVQSLIGSVRSAISLRSYGSATNQGAQLPGSRDGVEGHGNGKRNGGGERKRERS